MNFVWSEDKNNINIEKHGVSFYEAQLAFLDPHRVIAEDLEHSQFEKRYYCFGKIEEYIMTVRFTYRDKLIRIIGAGYWRKGRKIYEQEKIY
jgi:uncharacterized protein